MVVIFKKIFQLTLKFQHKGFFPKWNINSMNSGNLKHELAQFKDPVSHMCLSNVSW